MRDRLRQIYKRLSGRALTDWFRVPENLRDAAQEAAVYGSINPTDSSGINSRGMAVLTNRIDTSTVSISPTFSGACANGSNTIQVVVQFSNFNITMPFLGTLVGSQNFNITASVTDTILSPMCP